MTAFDKALDYFEGDPIAALRWFTSPCWTFYGETPNRHSATPEGEREVIELLTKLEYGVPI